MNEFDVQFQDTPDMKSKDRTEDIVKIICSLSSPFIKGLSKTQMYTLIRDNSVSFAISYFYQQARQTSFFYRMAPFICVVVISIYNKLD